MGVGDYIHSKEISQQHAMLHEASGQPRQFPAGTAAFEAPPMKLMAPVPLGPGMAGLPYAQERGAEQEDMFDTDVEGIDESTIGGNSVADTEEYQEQYSKTPRPQQLPYLPPPQEEPAVPQNEGTNARPLYQFRHGRRSHQPNWYESLGEKAMRSAGFESDDADDDGSQLTSVAGDDEPNDWYYSHKHRAGPDEPLSRRLDTFWNASKRMAPRSMSQLNLDHRLPTLTPSNSDPRKMEHIMSTGGNRKITLSRSMTTTPRTRFSPPKPSLLEQLDNSPTRQAGSRSRPRRSSVIDLRQRSKDNENENDTNQFTIDNNDKQDSVDGQSMTAFDITNVVALDEDDSIQDPFFKPDRNGTSPNSSPSPKKRHLEADYPPSTLYQKSFAELQAEPFERSPPATTSASTVPAHHPSLHDHETGPEDRYDLLVNLSEQDRRNYLSNLSMDEWEACGDVLLVHFSDMLTKMKDLRHARRRTAAIFEEEIRRRNDAVEEQSRDLSTKLDGMRSGGAEVLRGRTP